MRGHNVAAYTGQTEPAERARIEAALRDNQLKAVVATSALLERLLALSIGFAGTVALWWCYFERAEARGVRAAENAEDAGAVALWGTWTLALIVLGLIGIAVADELAIAHPSDDATLGFVVLAFGGPALFLLAQLLFRRAALGRAPRSRAVALAALAVLAVAAGQLALIIGIAAASGVLIAAAITDTVQAGVSGASKPA